VADVRISALHKHYGTFHAVRGIDLAIRDGEFTVLVGPSGCGKSTLLRMIAGLEEISDGKVEIGGEVVNDLRPRDRDVAMVFQDYALYPHMTVAKNIGFGLKARKMPPAEIESRVNQAARMLGITPLLDRYPRQLSGGQRQRVAIGRAIVRNPRIFLFDEPLSNLDARLRRSMREEIRALQQRLGLTVAYVTHDQSEALAVSDTIVVMRAAEIAQSGTPAELYDSPRDVFVATFMGEANRVAATIERREGTNAMVRLGTGTLVLPHRDLPDGAVDLVIRPESVRFAPDGGDAIEATVTRATFMGSHFEYHLGTAAGDLFAVLAREGAMKVVGEKVRLRFDPKGTILVRP